VNEGVVRPGKVLAAVLAILVIGSAARSDRHHLDVAEDTGAALNMRADVPAPVLSILRRACLDCHSEETRWPWYSVLPVASWLIEHDVEEGRRQINLSRWERYNVFDRADKLDTMCELATNSTMPLRPYRLLHPEARLSEADVTALCAWTGAEAARLVLGGS
jgi:hypothetical protein